MSEDHREIWLEPKCAENDPEGRVWCQHDVWPTCPECGDKSVKYVRADLYDALKDERDELKGAKWAEKHVDTMNDMAALRIALKGAEAEIDRLRAALREFNCPRPANDRPDDFEVGQCVDVGECGCGARFALTGEPVPGGIPLEETDGLVTAARELLAQLSDFEARIDDIDDEREFIGHVAPAAARLRSCLLDKPEAGEPVATVEIRDLKGGGGMRGLGHIQPEHWWAKQPSGTYYIYPAPQSATPADTDAAQMQEVALARATAREDLFPAMSSRIKAEREQARRKAFEEAAAELDRLRRELEGARKAHRETLDLLHIQNEKLNAAEAEIERLTRELEDASAEVSGWLSTFRDEATP